MLSQHEQELINKVIETNIKINELKASIKKEEARVRDIMQRENITSYNYGTAVCKYTESITRRCSDKDKLLAELVATKNTKYIENKITPNIEMLSIDAQNDAQIKDLYNHYVKESTTRRLTVK